MFFLVGQQSTSIFFSFISPRAADAGERSVHSEDFSEALVELVAGVVFIIDHHGAIVHAAGADLVPVLGVCVVAP